MVVKSKRVKHATRCDACSARSVSLGALTYTFRVAPRVAIDIPVCSAHSDQVNANAASMKRLFITIDLPDNVRSAAAVVIRYLQKCAPILETGRPSDLKPVKGISWVKPENLHVTIKFLGDTDEETEAKLIEKLDRISSTYSTFKLHLSKPEILGKRVMSIAVRSDTSTVFSLEMVIDTECERLGFKREGRRFHPHVTLARIRDPRASDLVPQFSRLQFESIEFDVREIVLYESRMTRAGSEYSKVRTFRLQN